MSIVHAFSPDVVHDLLVAAATATVAVVATCWRLEQQRQAVADDKQVIRAFQRSNDQWLSGHKAEFIADPQVAAGLAALADEVGLVQALSDQTHEDEQAPQDDEDRYLVALAAAFAVLGPVAWVWEVTGRVHDWIADRLKSNAARDAEFRTPATEPWTLWDEDELRQDGMSEDEIAALREGFVKLPAEPEPVEIVRGRYRDPGLTGAYPLVKVVGDKAAGRHRSAEIPAQRDGGDDL